MSTLLVLLALLTGGHAQPYQSYDPWHAQTHIGVMIAGTECGVELAPYPGWFCG